MVSRTLYIVLLIAGLSYLAAPAAADSLEDDRFSLSLGVFLTDREYGSALRFVTG